MERGREVFKGDELVVLRNSNQEFSEGRRHMSVTLVVCSLLLQEIPFK